MEGGKWLLRSWAFKLVEVLFNTDYLPGYLKNLFGLFFLNLKFFPECLRLFLKYFLYKGIHIPRGLKHLYFDCPHF